MNKLIYKVVNFVIEITNLAGPNLLFQHANSYSVPYQIAFSSLYGNHVERIVDHSLVSIINRLSCFLILQVLSISEGSVFHIIYILILFRDKCDYTLFL